MKKFKMFLLYFILTLCFSSFLFPLHNGDEIWNYGFSYNISVGLIPYKDFSMLQTPLYFYIGSIFIKIFGSYLISVHVFDALFISLIMLMLHDMIGKKSLFFYPLLIIYLLPSYNYFCLFFIFLIIYLVFKKRDNDLLIAFIVGLVFMTKQNVGITMFLPMIFYSKNRIKSILMFLIPFSVFSLYFIFNGAFFEFMDHCFLGMIDFGEKNTMITHSAYVEVFEVIFIIYKLIKGKFRDKILFYILAFQIISYPIFDNYHWLIAAIPFLYYLIISFNEKSFFKIDYLLMLIITSGWCLYILAFGLYSYFVTFGDCNIVTGNNYFFLRNVNDDVTSTLDYEFELMEEYSKGVDYKFFIMENIYLLKLYFGMEIGEYDMLLNGNMGFNGDIKKIEEIKRICENNSCVFFVDSGVFERNKNSQLSKKIYGYVASNYNKIVGGVPFDIYIN